LTITKIASLALLCLSAILLIGLQLKPEAWLVLSAGALTLLFCGKKFRNYLLLVYLSVVILGLTPITTEISWGHIAIMGTTLLAALFLPYAISHFLWKDRLLKFQFLSGQSWHRSEVIYILVTAALAYFLVPFYLKNTGAYLNWTVEPGASNILRFFAGTNLLGIWDELFFIGTVLSILRKFIPFGWANLAQATLFTSFLYELGFTGWGPAAIFIFALSQGYIYKKTESLLYIITIHLTLDFVLFLALLNAHHPTWVPIFIT